MPTFLPHHAPAGGRWRNHCALLFGAALALASCGKNAPPSVAAPIEVTTITVKATDVPLTAEYVAQTQSSQAVNIQSRVSGFLDRRVYTEGAVVKAGQLLFQIDPKPFQVQVDGATAALQRHQASLQVASANLKRIKPLVEQNALSQKDLDDALGQYEQAAATVAQAKAQLESAQLNLSYTRITSPVNGVTSYSTVAEGTYVNAQNSQLTTVSVLRPMWVNFSLSENDVERMRDKVKKGLLKLPANNKQTIEIELSDGTRFGHSGKITFTDPEYNSQTGTFLVRATVDNPDGLLRPNQYVRALVVGAVRPNAILVPQRAVQQGAQGHYVWLVDKDGKAEQRPIVVDDWYRDGWFVSEGLHGGDQVVVDGALRLSVGASVTAHAPSTGSGGS
jgi:membrane fusion protein (multidrug efflux system)